MADGFTDLIREVSTELVASADTRLKLAAVSRLTPEGLLATLTDADGGAVEEGLRTQLAGGIQAVEAALTAREQAIYASLPEAVALDAAQRRWTAAQVRYQYMLLRDEGEDPRIEGWFRDYVPTTVRRLPFMPRLVPPPVPLSWSAERVLRRAWQARDIAKRNFDAAAANLRGMDQERLKALGYQGVADAEARRAEALSPLRTALHAALSLLVNEIIDDAMEASYERDFSYLGEPWLPDMLGSAAQEPVSTEAYREVKYQIDNVRAVPGPSVRWGICVSAPTKYDARDFLLHLFGQLCIAVLGPDRVRGLEARMTSTAPVAAWSACRSRSPTCCSPCPAACRGNWSG